VNAWHLVAAAAALSLERICYVWVWHRPDAFRRFCLKPRMAALGEPIDVLCKLFCGFKCLQIIVFFGWCYIYGDGLLLPPAQGAVSLGLGGTLMLIGQLLNFSVFHRLGKIGVFYGNKFGYSIPWCDTFPFSLLSHPQYVGAVLTIWGFFMVARFPHDDWYVLPLLQTGYYLLGAYLEQPRAGDLTQTVLNSRPIAQLISRVTDLNHRHNLFRGRAG
jgi:phosphatidyl-N-methylethanolamine N-methyltransferase